MVEGGTIECAVVGEATPTYYSPGQRDFVTSLESTLADVPDDIVEFDSTPEDRSTFSHPHFSLTAQQITTSDPMMLLARAYYGETDRDERRSWVPVQAGAVPSLPVFGTGDGTRRRHRRPQHVAPYRTPRDANSYLQRIGRAGRESGSSLVHSVSQRNPIDYYYHEHPEELIASDPQQVPLNEVNREVLHQSLTWESSTG